MTCARDEQSWFTGRTAEVDQVVAWVRSGEPGVHVITGSAGTGKTAIAGRVVSLSNPEERERLMAEQVADAGGWPFSHADPGERSVDAHVHARGLTADQVADLAGDQLVRAQVLTAQAPRRNAAELIGQLQWASEEGNRCSVTTDQTGDPDVGATVIPFRRKADSRGPRISFRGNTTPQ